MNEERVGFHCPGCKSSHMVPVSGPYAWGWNGSMESPTFTPSIRVTYNGSDGALPSCCHSFVRDGSIQFLDDSTHEFAGTTVEIPDWDSA